MSKKTKGLVTRKRVRGFSRIQLVNSKTGQIEGDSGWNENVISSWGFEEFIVGSLGGISNSQVIGYMAIANDAAIASDDGTLASELADRNALVTSATDITTVPHMKFVSPGTLQMCVSWAGVELTASTPNTIQAIAAFSTNAGGSMCCGNTFTASQWTTDQDVNATYQIQFS